jgi:hypothetical protein
MRKPLRPEELFDAALALRERAEKAEADVERLRTALQCSNNRNQRTQNPRQMTTDTPRTDAKQLK